MRCLWSTKRTLYILMRLQTKTSSDMATKLFNLTSRTHKISTLPPSVASTLWVRHRCTSMLKLTIQAWCSCLAIFTMAVMNTSPQANLNMQCTKLWNQKRCESFTLKSQSGTWSMIMTLGKTTLTAITNLYSRLWKAMNRLYLVKLKMLLSWLASDLSRQMRARTCWQTIRLVYLGESSLTGLKLK